MIDKSSDFWEGVFERKEDLLFASLSRTDTRNTVVGDQVLLVFSDALETDFCRIFTASMLTKGE